VNNGRRSFWPFNIGLRILTLESGITYSYILYLYVVHSTIRVREHAWRWNYLTHRLDLIIHEVSTPQGSDPSGFWGLWGVGSGMRIWLFALFGFSPVEFSGERSYPGDH